MVDNRHFSLRTSLFVKYAVGVKRGEVIPVGGGHGRQIFSRRLGIENDVIRLIC